MDDGLAAVPALDLANLRLLLNLVVIVLAAAVAGMYLVDLEAMGQRIVEYTRAVITKSNVDHARRSLLRGQQSFLKDMLYFLDGLRYDPGFQYIFCTWPFGVTEEGD
jgi:hypothetical protein